MSDSCSDTWNASPPEMSGAVNEGDVRRSGRDVQGEPALLTEADIRSLPKVSLHDHLDGGIRLQTILELSEQAGLPLPANDVAGLQAWFAECATAGSLVEYLRSDDITTAITQTAEALRRIGREAVEDLADDGVVYAELRWAPECVREKGLSLEAAIEAVQAGLDEGVRAVSLERGCEMRVGQILCAMRTESNSSEIARLAVRHRDAGVVGFDIAGAEAGHPASDHREAFEYLFGEAFPVTIHAGEADGLESIASAVFDGRAMRLGHGIRLAEDLGNGSSSSGALASWVREHRIVLETSPSSNVHTAAIAPWGRELRDHPFDRLYRSGFAVTVNTDNRTTSGTTLSRELDELCRTFGYGLDDVESFQTTAAEGAFQPQAVREELQECIRRGFHRFRAVAQSR